MTRPSRALRSLGLLLLVAVVVTAAAPGTIRIHRGDTLSELARRHHTTVAMLQALNRMGGSTTIYAGQLLRVPTSGSTTRRTPTGTYVVRPGDGLIVVARRLGTTPSALKAVNHLHRDYLILGERLRYRTAAPRVSPALPRGVAQSVARSAAVHRAALRFRQLPSKAKVRELVRRSARRHGVPVSLALALAYQESGFQQRVVSPVDAIGVMQVLPSTARSLGRLHGRTFHLLDTAENVEAGVVLLRDLLDATGSVDRALAGYYQGLGSIARQGLLPQTRQYVRNVQVLRRQF